MLIWDIETNGFLKVLSKVHCIVIYDTLTKKYDRYNNQNTVGQLGYTPNTIQNGIDRLEEAEAICGHNIIGFDIPAIQKVYPGWSPKGKVIDTLVISQLIWTNLKDIDSTLIAKKKVPPEFNKYFGRHALAAWGFRLGELKGDFGETTDWAEWSLEMEDYCEQDVVVNVKLWEKIVGKKYSQEAIDLEHDVKQIIHRQERFGFKFDERRGAKLYSSLVKRKNELSTELCKIFTPWYSSQGLFTPKRKHGPFGYAEGVTFTKIKLNVFNPGSRDHIGQRMQAVFGWEPMEYNKGDGKPTVNEDILKSLPYESSKLLVEYLTIDKRLGMLAEGKNAWLKLVDEGRIHGSVITNGAVTGRMTHSYPNVAQVPAARSPYGKECRSLFGVDDGYILVGADASGLELRCLGHYMARYDKGKYAEAVIHGTKEKGTDAHTLNQKAAGLFTRDGAKTFIYGLLYGAGDFKLGEIYVDDMPTEMREIFDARYPGGEARRRKLCELGKRSRGNLLSGLPALGKLTKAVKEAAKRGFLVGLDGRRLHIRSSHAALNTLLQGAGALIMKKALVILDDALIKTGLQHSGMKDEPDYEFVANVHDEFQIQVLEKNVDVVKEWCEKSMVEAGEYFNFRCRIDGEADAGETWYETH